MIERQWEFLDRRAEEFRRHLERHPGAWLIAFTLLYCASAAIQCKLKPFWFDELFTVYIARLPDLRSMMRISAVDSHPPLSYLLTKASVRLFGATEFAARLPEFLGFWGMCLALFQFVRTRLSAVYGFVALAIPLLTDAYQYSYEARPYGLVLGFSALGLLAWQMAADGKRRIISVPLLAASVAGAISSHYYAVIAIGCTIVAGEIARTLTRRRVDIAVWCALCVGFCPLVFLLPAAWEAARLYTTNVANFPIFWAKPSIARIGGFYYTLLSPLTFPVILLVAAVSLPNWPVAAGGSERPVRGLYLHEKIAVAGCLALPFVMVAFTKWRTGYFMGRYALPTVLGVAIVSCAALDRFFPRRAAVLLLVLITGSFAGTGLYLGAAAKAAVPSLEEAVGVAAGNAPIVIADPLLYLVMAHYEAPAVVSRLYYLADRKFLLEKPDIMPELGIVAGRLRFPGNVRDFSGFISEHPSFWVVSNSYWRTEWVPHRLIGSGYRLELRSQNGGRLFFYASRAAR